MNNAVAIRDEAKTLVDDIAGDLTGVLPSNIPFERFKATFITAVAHNPKILDCDAQSVKTALMKAAIDNLLPDNREAAIVPYNTKEKGPDGRDVWINKAQYMPMVQGVRKRALELGGVRIDAEVVHESDFFDAEFGDTPFIKHKPAAFGKDRGEIIGAYAIFKDDKTGEIVHRELMSREAIEKSRSISKAANSPAWQNFYQEMARKTVLRRGSKSVPTLSENLRTVIEREDEYVDFDKQAALDKRTIDHNPLIDERSQQQRLAPANGVAMDTAQTKDRAPSSTGSEQRNSTSQADGSSPSAHSNSSSPANPDAPHQSGGDDRQGGIASPQRLPADLFRKYASQIGRMATADNVGKAHDVFWKEHGSQDPAPADAALAKQILDRHTKRAKGEIDVDGLADDIEALILASFEGL